MVKITRLRISDYRGIKALDAGTDGYAPSLYGSPEHFELADAYDRAQEERGDARRAFRGCP